MSSTGPTAYEGVSDMYNQKAHASGSGGYEAAQNTDSGGLKQSVQREERGLFDGVLAGPRSRRRREADPRLVRYNRADAIILAKKEGLTFGASRNVEMRKEIAGDLMDKIFSAYDVHEDDIGRRENFLNAVLLYHSLNSASVSQPHRGELFVGDNGLYGTKRASGGWVEADLMLDILGNDQRRFFRAYTHEVRAVNNMVLGWVESKELAHRDAYDSLYQVVRERNMERYPDLVHDTAEFCTATTDEFEATQRAKVAAVPKVNVADSFRGSGQTVDSVTKDMTPRAVRNDV